MLVSPGGDHPPGQIVVMPPLSYSSTVSREKYEGKGEEIAGTLRVLQEITEANRENWKMNENKQEK